MAKKQTPVKEVPLKDYAAPRYSEALETLMRGHLLWIRYVLHRFPLFEAAFDAAPLHQLPFNTQRWLMLSPGMFYSKELFKTHVRARNYNEGWTWLMEKRNQAVLEPLTHEGSHLWSLKQCLPIEILGMSSTVKACGGVECWNYALETFLTGVETAWKSWLEKNTP